MKYSAKRNYTHPVLRPYAMDYGQTESFEATLGPPVVNTENETLVVSLYYDVSVASVSETVQAGDAVCAAMVYCSKTLHRETLRAEPGQFELTGEIDLGSLDGQVEIHPVIAATRDFEPVLHGKHAEYGEAELLIRNGQPLAMDQAWFFTLDAKELESTESIFFIRQNHDLEPGYVQVDADPGMRYIDVSADANTYSKLQKIRLGNPDDAIVSLWLGPIMEALTVLLKEEIDGEIDDPSAWMVALRARLSYYDLLPLEGKSIFQVAQRIFDYPYGRLTFDEKTNEEDE